MKHSCVHFRATPMQQDINELGWLHEESAMNTQCFSNVSNLFPIAMSIAIAITFTNATAGKSQGVSEYGGALGHSSTHAAAGMRNATQNSFGAVDRAFHNAMSGKGGSSVSGKSSGNSSHSSTSAVHTYDDDDAARYADIAGKQYQAAQAAMKRGDSKTALTYLNNAIATRQNVWGTSDPYLARLFHEQGDLYQKLDNQSDAINSYKKALMAETKQSGNYSAQAEATTKEISDLCERSGDSSQACNFLAKLHEIQMHRNAQAPETKSTTLKLCTSLIFGGNYDQCEALLKQAIADQTAASKPDNSYLSKLYETYGALLRETHRDDDAASFEKQAMALKDGSTPQGPQAAAH